MPAWVHAQFSSYSAWRRRLQLYSEAFLYWLLFHALNFRLSRLVLKIWQSTGISHCEYGLAPMLATTNNEGLCASCDPYEAWRYQYYCSLRKLPQDVWFLFSYERRWWDCLTIR